MTTSAEVRSQLIDALRLDLVGARLAEPGHALYQLWKGVDIVFDRWF